MIWQYTTGRKWQYSMVLDIADQDQGVMFKGKGTPETIKVLFAGNWVVCIDWAMMPREAFFDKYSQHGLADVSCLEADNYLARKRMELGLEKSRRKPLNVRAA